MAASSHEKDARGGLATAAKESLRDNPMERCSSGGKQAAVTTPGGLPVIREWEYGEGSVIVFSKIDSCLGAVQVDGGTLRGAHFSMYANMEFTKFDRVQFDKTMMNAGFKVNCPIYFFGGGVSDWQGGLQGSTWWDPHNRKSLPFQDAAQKAWIFEMVGGKWLTHHCL